MLAFAGLFWTTLWLPAQTIIENFPGVNYNDDTNLGNSLTPPDTMGAAGTNQFVEFINGAFAVYSKNGVRQMLISDSTFWENAGISAATISAGLTDTHITYDPGSGRWIASELTVNTTGNSVLLARSDSSNPTGTWKAVSFTATASDFGDFDTLGVDSLGVYIGVNLFTRRGAFAGVSFFSIPKTDLLAATPTLANMTQFNNLNANTYGFALQGVNNPDAGRGHGVIMAIDNSQFGRFDRTTINSPGAAGATLSGTTYISTAYDSTPNPATQPGGNLIDGGDDRFSAAVRQIGGYIFIANCFLNDSKDAVHWMVVNETNNTLTSEGIVSDPNYDFIYPSIVANHSGQVLMAFNRIGTTAPAGDVSIYAVAGTVTNGIVTMGAPFLLKQGTVNNYAGIGVDPSPYRWGDYSTTMSDPTDDNLLWTIQEIPTSSTAWATQIALISMDTNRPALTITRTLAGGATTAVNLRWPLRTDPTYVLQSSTNLANAAAWSTVTNVPVVSLNQNVVTLPFSNRATFFRLQN